MIKYATFDDLRRFTSKILNEGALRKSASESLSAKNTFLSYSSKDDAVLPGVISVLENNGASVYIDKKDSSLPDTPSAITAEKLRHAIHSCRKFVLFVTTNSKESKWIPWELGLSDGDKGSIEIALFPTSEKSDDIKWAEQEYLGLYQRIVWTTLKGEFEPTWIVYNHFKNTGTKLRDWIAGT